MNIVTWYKLAEPTLEILSLVLAAIFFGWQGALVCFVLLFYVNVRSTLWATKAATAAIAVMTDMMSKEATK